MAGKPCPKSDRVASIAAISALSHGSFTDVERSPRIPLHPQVFDLGIVCQPEFGDAVGEINPIARRIGTTGTGGGILLD